MTWVLIIGLFFLGVWGLVHKRNLIKKIMGLNIATAAAVILFVYLASLSGESAPILGAEPKTITDPLPQALMITVIIVAVCITAFSLTLVYLIHRRCDTTDVEEIEEMLQGREEPHD
jgi:multicomponent Na+:H+ antiporter subunit C